MKIRSPFRLFAIIILTFLSLGGIATFGQQPAQQQTPVEVKIDSKTFDAYTGQYEDKTNLPGLVFSFFREGDQFYGRVTNQDKFEMFPSSETKFFLKILQAEGEFTRDTKGKVTGMTWRQGGRELTTKKIADTPEKDLRIPYKRTEAMVPMRDGVKLYTVILTPETQTEPAAILMDRTPYGVKGYNPSAVNNRKLKRVLR